MNFRENELRINRENNKSESCKNELASCLNRKGEGDGEEEREKQVGNAVSQYDGCIMRPEWKRVGQVSGQSINRERESKNYSYVSDKKERENV